MKLANIRSSARIYQEEEEEEEEEEEVFVRGAPIDRRPIVCNIVPHRNAEPGRSGLRPGGLRLHAPPRCNPLAAVPRAGGGAAVGANRREIRRTHQQLFRRYRRAAIDHDD